MLFQEDKSALFGVHYWLNEWLNDLFFNDTNDLNLDDMWLQQDDVT